jgi:cytochrome c-type biogenesis protein CcmE
MTPARKRRLDWVLGILAGVSIAGALALSAFQKNVMFFFDPTQVAAGEVKQGQRFRLGGMVTKGSFHRVPGTLEVNFVVTDFKHDLPVKYTGVLPDLFREGQGVVAHGKLGPNGVFVADEVLAKHDEKYMPPEVARSLKHGEPRTGLPEAGSNGSATTNAEAPANTPAGT